MWEWQRRAECELVPWQYIGQILCHILSGWEWPGNRRSASGTRRHSCSFDKQPGKRKCESAPLDIWVRLIDIERYTLRVRTILLIMVNFKPRKTNLHYPSTRKRVPCHNTVHHNSDRYKINLLIFKKKKKKTIRISPCLGLFETRQANKHAYLGNFTNMS